MERIEDAEMIFTASGAWRPDGGHPLAFHNVFRWSGVGDNLRLEHLRYGADHPVHLFDLEPTVEGWRSVAPHVCSADCSTASLLVAENHLYLRWTITGPRKQQTIENRYLEKGVAPCDQSG